VLISDEVNICREVKESGGGIVAPDDLAGTETPIDQFLALCDAAREEMGATARQCFLKNFEISRSAERLLDLIEELKHRG